MPTVLTPSPSKYLTSSKYFVNSAPRRRTSFTPVWDCGCAHKGIGRDTDPRTVGHHNPRPDQGRGKVRLEGGCRGTSDRKEG